MDTSTLTFVTYTFGHRLKQNALKGIPTILFLFVASFSLCFGHPYTHNFAKILKTLYQEDTFENFIFIYIYDILRNKLQSFFFQNINNLPTPDF